MSKNRNFFIGDSRPVFHGGHDGDVFGTEKHSEMRFFASPICMPIFYDA